jgi:hypothetical protein
MATTRCYGPWHPGPWSPAPTPAALALPSPAISQPSFFAALADDVLAEVETDAIGDLVGTVLDLLSGLS